MPDSDLSAPKPQNDGSYKDDSAVSFAVQFWGVRARIATPGKDAIRYGGNTACVEIRVAGKRLIFDGGTGLRVLGNSLLRQMPVEAHLFFTHCHWDRIQGFPFFIPAFVPGNRFHIYGAEAADGASMEYRLCQQMRDPNFPVPIQVMQSELKFHNFTSGQKLLLDDVTVETDYTNYGHRSIGYRISWHGRTAIYATDLAGDRQTLQQLSTFVDGADLLILGALKAGGEEKSLSFDEREALLKTSLEVANAANVKQVILSIHDLSLIHI